MTEAGEQYLKIQETIAGNHTAEELDGIYAVRKAWAGDAYANGAYGSALEHATTASLARQLAELIRRLPPTE